MYHAGSFIKGRSFVHNLDPRVKFSAAVIFSIFILRVQSSWALVIGIALLFAALISGISLRTIGQALKPLLFFIALIFVVHVFFNENNDQVLISHSFFKLSFSSTGLQQGFFVVWRFLCLILAAILLTMTTTPSQMIAAIKYFLKPFKRLRVPVDDIAVMLMLALRLMPILLAEKERIDTARQARGYDLSHSGLVRRIQSFLQLTSKVLIGVFRRADELALAMEARNYQRGERSSFVELKLTSYDYPVIFLLIFPLFIFVALNLHFG